MKRLVLAAAALFVTAASSPAALANGPCLLGVGNCAPTGGPSTTTTPEQPGRTSWMDAAAARRAYATGRVITGAVRDAAGNITHITYRPVITTNTGGRAGNGDDLDQVGVVLGDEVGWVPYVQNDSPAVIQLAHALLAEIAAIDSEYTGLDANRARATQLYNASGDAQYRAQLADYWHKATARMTYLLQVRAVKAASYEGMRTEGR